MRKFYLLPLLAASLAFSAAQAEEETQASCSADSYAEKVHSEMEQANAQEEATENNENAPAAATTAETETTIQADHEDPSAVFAEEKDEFDIPHLSFGEFEEEDVTETSYDWENETSSDNTSSFWDDLEEETASNDEFIEGAAETTQGQA